MTYYNQLSVDDRLALLNLIEKELKSTESIDDALLITDRLLIDLGVVANLDEVGSRLKLSLGCSLQQILLTYYLLGEDSFQNLFPPSIL